MTARTTATARSLRARLGMTTLVPAWVQRPFAARRFTAERIALRDGVPARHGPPSVLHLSVNKAATQFVKRLLAVTAESSGHVFLNLNGWAAWTHLPYADHLDDVTAHPHWREVWSPRGYVYSPFAGMIHGLPGAPAYRHLVVVRDPRDVLVSDYFSARDLHPLPGGDKRGVVVARRQAAARSTLLDHAAASSGRLVATFRDYAELAERPTTTVLRYEDLMAEPRAALDTLAMALSLDCVPPALAAYFEEHRLAGAAVADHRKVRSGAVGQWHQHAPRAVWHELLAPMATAAAVFGYDV